MDWDGDYINIIKEERQREKQKRKVVRRDNHVVKLEEEHTGEDNFISLL
jgi:hypothetical protein